MNCQRFDAEVAGHLSLCGLLSRLCSLYKWGHGLPPWREEAAALVLEWVSQREGLWLELLGQEPQPQRLAGQALDPFDSASLNASLEPLDLVYGAWRVGGLLPAFFLRALGTQPYPGVAEGLRGGGLVGARHPFPARPEP